jgi:hypothetical protein
MSWMPSDWPLAISVFSAGVNVSYNGSNALGEHALGGRIDNREQVRCATEFDQA